ncbi:MAG TPA: hypothetical protein VFC34_00005 [Puia sp.]|nr:hypothetical protein [Puia sp.]
MRTRAATIPFCFILILFSVSAVGQDFRVVRMLQGNDSISFAAVRYNRTDYGIAVVDANARVKWQLPVPGYILGMGRQKDELFVFYTEMITMHNFSRKKTIHVITVSLKRRSQVSDNIAFTNPGNHTVVPEVLNDPDGNFNFLLVRTTGNKGSGMVQVGTAGPDKEANTDLVSIITLDDAGNASATDIPTMAQNGKYIVSCTDAGKNLYLTSFVDGKLTMEYFDRSLKLVSSLATPLDLKEKYEYKSVIRCDGNAPNAVDFSLYYENNSKRFNNALYRFDFSAKKVLTAPEVPLTKEYIRDKQAQNPGSAFSSLKVIDELKPVGILETPDKILVVKEIQYVYSKFNPQERQQADRFTHEGAVVEIYSKDLKLLHELALGKYVETFVETGYDVNFHIKDGNLFVVSCEQGGVASYADYVYVISLNDYSVSRKALARAGAGRDMYMEAANMIWNTNNFITPVSYVREFFGTTFRTSFQKYTYDQILKN